MQTTFGSLNPSSMVKVTWGIAQALIAFVLLLAGGGDGTKHSTRFRVPPLLVRFHSPLSSY